MTIEEMMKRYPPPTMPASEPCAECSTKEADRYFAEHYQGAIQPIEIMQAVLSQEAFCGFLAGNCIKYGYRAGHKDGESAEKDRVKFERYHEWLVRARNGEVIDPRKD